MLKRRVFAPGDPIGDFTADDYNALARELERLAKLSASAPLTLSRGADGRVLGLEPSEEFYAQLSGSSSPYSWTEVIPQAGGTWFTAYRTGTASAYEVNGASGLGGKVVRLTPTVANDYRFQRIAFSTTCTSSTRICVAVTDGCSTPANVGGATVTVKKGGSTVGTCSTNSSGQCCVTVTVSGSYTVEVSVPGATTITQTVSVTCNVDNNVTMSFDRTTNPVGKVCISATLCDGSTGGIAIQPSISISGAGSVSGTGDPSGMTCYWVGVGTYSATLSYGAYSEVQSFTVSACATTSLSFAVVTGTYISLFFGVPGCAYTFTIKDGGGTTVGTCMITADGFGNGDCTITYSEQKLDNTVTGTITITATVTNITGGFSFNCYTPSAPFLYNAGHLC